MLLKRTSDAPAYNELIHALRGVASLWVVLFHLEKFGGARAVVDALGPTARQVIFDWGRSGVAVFFVLSGYVIAKMVFGDLARPMHLRRFALRRSIRLDLPYWASIALTIAFALLASAFGDARPPDLDAARIVAHAVYLQDLLRMEPFQVIYWTLCLEVQFYVVLALAAKGLRQVAPATRALALDAVLAAFTVLAFVSAFLGPTWAPPGLFLNHWHGFLLGVLLHQARESMRWGAALFVLAVFTLAVTRADREIFDVPAALTALALLGLMAVGVFDRFRLGAPLALLGNLSYSLYLTHILAILATMSIVRLALGGEAQDMLLLPLGALVTALVGAYGFWVLVERPSHALARRVRQ